MSSVHAGRGPAPLGRAVERAVDRSVTRQPALPSLREAAMENRRCSRRVRHEFRDGLAVAAFSLGASTGLTLVVTFALSRVG